MEPRFLSLLAVVQSLYQLTILTYIVNIFTRWDVLQEQMLS